MDEFAQSRGDDDLFDDEIIPIEQPPQSVQDLTAQVEQISIKQPPVNTGQPETQDSRNSARGRGRGRGRGSGGPLREPSKQHDLGQSKYAPRVNTPRKESPRAPIIEQASSEPQHTADGAEILKTNIEDASAQSTPQIPTGPANPTPSRPPAVRGDRTNTGGLARTKLTEDELNAKLLAAKERSQNLAAAHARAQADAENFAAREQIAIQKRAKETAERKVMEGERERNRERKLKGQGGREWDARKQDIDFAGRGRGDGTRQMFDHTANQEEQDLSMYEWHEDNGRGRGRGRGGRGGRGRGRGDTANGLRRGGSTQPQQRQPDLQAESDFPALPGATTKVDKKKPVLDRHVSETEPAAGTSWADQVESSEAQKAR